MKDYSKLSLWSLAYDLNPSREERCREIDPHLATKLNTINDLVDIYYYLCYGKIHNFLPLTRKKINEIVLKETKTNEWGQFKNFGPWFDDNTRKKLVKRWLEIDTMRGNLWMIDVPIANPDINLKILSKLVGAYKKRKLGQIVKIIDKTFLNFSADRIEEACKIISASTPAIVSIMLKREDISDEYTLKGLKALSKLSKQRDVQIQIDFNMLSHLGPKGRLDAMKQLMGMFDKYFQFKQTQKQSSYKPTYRTRYIEQRLKRKSKEYSLPFKEIPNREEIETFLFPCSIKYNDEVASMMERFDEFIKKETQ